MTKTAILSAFTILFVLPASAIEVGDKFFLGASIKHTVTAVLKKGKHEVEFNEAITEADAKEYCEWPVFGLAYPDLKSCVGKTMMKARKILIDCHPATITIAEETYRPMTVEGPWTSLTVRHHIIQGDELFDLACGIR